MGKPQNHRRIGFCPDPEPEVKEINQPLKPEIRLCEEYLNVILASFREWFQAENMGGLFNNNHDTHFINKINAARLLYKKGGKR